MIRHMLITLADEDKIRTVEQIDRLVSAEVPDPDLDPSLHEIVKDNMIHGPCDQGKFACNGSGTCSKNFPKQFRQSTVICEDVRIDLTYLTYNFILGLSTLSKAPRWTGRKFRKRKTRRSQRVRCAVQRIFVEEIQLPHQH